MGLDQIPLNFPLGCGLGSDPPQFPPWLWAWRGVFLGGLPGRGVSLVGVSLVGVSLEGGLPGIGVSLVGGLPGRGVSLAGDLLRVGSPWQGVSLVGVSLVRVSPWWGVSLAGGGGLPGRGSPW